MYEVSVVVYRFVDCSCVRLSVRAIHANSAYMQRVCLCMYYCGSAACEAYLFDTGLQLYPFATRLQLYPTVTLRNTELRCIFSRLEREGARPRSDMAHPDPPAATSEYELFGIAFVQRDGGGSPRVARAGREGGEGCGTATAARAAARAALRVMRPTRGESVEGNRTIHYKHEAALVLTERRRPAVCNLLCGCRAPGGVEIIRNTCDYSVYTKGVTEGVKYCKDQPN